MDATKHKASHRLENIILKWAILGDYRGIERTTSQVGEFVHT